MGADHTAGYAVATNILKVGGFVDPLKPEGQADLSRNLQIATAGIDAAGLCVFIAFAVLDIPSGLEAIPKMLNGQYGWNLTLDDVMEYGKRLPEFFSKEPLTPHNVVFDVTDEELDTVLDF
jgi:aldehyde:ferredoxin oxidoreductase